MKANNVENQCQRSLTSVFETYLNNFEFVNSEQEILQNSASSASSELYFLHHPLNVWLLYFNCLLDVLLLFMFYNSFSLSLGLVCNV